MIWVVAKELATGELKGFFVAPADLFKFDEGMQSKGFELVWDFDADEVKQVLADDIEAQTSANAEAIEEQASKDPRVIALAKSPLYVGYSMATVHGDDLFKHTEAVESDGGHIVATYPMQEAFNLVAARAVQLYEELQAHRRA